MTWKNHLYIWEISMDLDSKIMEISTISGGFSSEHQEFRRKCQLDTLW